MSYERIKTGLREASALLKKGEVGRADTKIRSLSKIGLTPNDIRANLTSAELKQLRDYGKAVASEKRPRKNAAKKKATKKKATKKKTPARRAVENAKAGATACEQIERASDSLARARVLLKGMGATKADKHAAAAQKNLLALVKACY